ncbi:hypothetical protein UPYG_G00101730 [Umbra pygmaea]|uniref:Nucleolar protein 12 n=1 Tax=Umbra pygmaea TaxID=75934 RepID=A0ABD0X4U7_UMBPY
MKNLKNWNKKLQKRDDEKNKSGSKKREKCVVMFDDSERQGYLTGFHKRKVERRKAAVLEIQNKIKEEQKRVREERHKEYLKLLQERKEALEEDEEDELEDVVTSTTKSVQYDHPNHTVTVTTISDLDLSRASLFAPTTTRVNENGEEEELERITAMPKTSGKPILNKKICSLNAALHARQKQRKGSRKSKQDGRGKGRLTDNKPTATEKRTGVNKTSKKQRRRLTGKREHHKD